MIREMTNIRGQWHSWLRSWVQEPQVPNFLRWPTSHLPLRTWAVTHTLCAWASLYIRCFEDKERAYKGISILYST